MSKKYIKIEDENDDENEEPDDNQKTVTMTIEGSNFLTTYFSEPITNGELTISLGSGTDSETVYNYAKQGGMLAMLINNEEMPLTYTISSSEVIANDIGENTLKTIIIIFAVIIVLIICYLIFKYKIDGLYAGLSFISGIAILLLLLRGTNTPVTLGGFAAIASLVIVETYLIITMLNSVMKDKSIENVKEANVKTYMKKIDIIITLLIISIVFTFMQEAKVYSVGMTLFYGIISLAIANVAFLRTLLISNHE